MEDGRFGYRLQREGKVAMMIGEGLVTLARRTERIDKPLLEWLLQAVGVVADQVAIY